MPLAPDELQGRLKGLFAFPVSPFTSDGEVDLGRYHQLLQAILSGQPQALFACGGTGEFFSLNLPEYHALIAAAVDEAQGAVPVIAGTGYGTRLAIEFARAAEEAGADGVLVLPPYLLQSEQEGLFQHYRAIAGATRLGVIIYQRDNAIFSPHTAARLAEIPNIIGLKDGYGDMERLGRIQLAVGNEFCLLNGMPTAELSALAFGGLGIYAYSSAVFNFVPEISRRFYKALTELNSKLVHEYLETFYRPLAELRDRKRGYAVSLIKAGVGLRSTPVGPARPPLVNPSEGEIQELKAIIEQGLRIL
ncbi:MAG TPA: 5-dehydro-4-deoxyglucarate dehydratase [Terriglobia bacterium]|nr:5-dehydro-4-deoxyglucarate dehydratase [Terriglobia bacterium]